MSETASILVVDDEPANRKILARLLGSEFDVTLADCGENALEQLAHGVPDLVILDVMMPDINGYEVCRQLRAEPRLEAVPVLFLSARSSVEEVIAGYSAGGDDYVTKPFSHDVLLRKVRKRMESATRQRALSERLDSANHVAFQAMSDAANLGVVNRFVHDAFLAPDHDALAGRLFDTAEELGLSCSLRLDTPWGNRHYHRAGRPQPLEQELLDRIVQLGRIYDFGARTALNWRHCTLLVKNMPIEDPARYGAAKDYLAILLDGLDNAVQALNARVQLDESRKTLTALIRQTAAALARVQGRSHELKIRSAAIVENMTEELEEAIARLGELTELHLEHEEALVAVATRCRTRTDALFSEGLDLDREFSSSIERLSGLLDDGRIDDARVNAILSEMTRGATG